MIKRSYPYFVNYPHWAERVIKYLVQAGNNKFIIYPFGERGKLAKSILNVYHGIQEYMIIDNLLSKKYSQISSLEKLKDVDLSDVIVLITSDRDDYISEQDAIFKIAKKSFYDDLRKALYEFIPKEKCIELFPRPPIVYEIADKENVMSIDYQMHLEATRETAKYIIDNFSRSAKKFSNRYAMYESILEEYVNFDMGMMLEFGVAGGISINFIASFNPTKQMYGFDSFEGLPLDWVPGSGKKGSFTMMGNMPVVNENVCLIKGWFDKTIPNFILSNDENISFIHIDCDIYDSAKIVLSLLRDRFVVGTIIIFDEYFNYPGWQKHEHRAFQEFVTEQGIKYEYIAYCCYEVAVRITDIRKRFSEPSQASS